MKNLVEQALVEEKQSEIIEVFDNLFRLGYETNRNKEFYDSLKAAKKEALERNMRGAELSAFVEPLFKALDNAELESKFTKEQKAQDRAIWEDEKLKVKRAALKNDLNAAFRNLVIKARNNYANEAFITKIRETQRHCHKFALGIREIQAEISELEPQITLAENQLNANQKLTKDKFDAFIKQLSEECEENSLTINQFNSGNYKDISLWNEIFFNYDEAIAKDIPQHIVDKVITQLSARKDRVIENILFWRKVKEIKKQMSDENIDDKAE